MNGILTRRDYLGASVLAFQGVLLMPDAAHADQANASVLELDGSIEAREMWAEKKSGDIIRCKSKRTKLTIPTMLVFAAVLAMMMIPALKKVTETNQGGNSYAIYDSQSSSDGSSVERSYSVLRTGSEK